MQDSKSSVPAKGNMLVVIQSVELIQLSKTTWVAGLEVAVHELPALMELPAHLHSEPSSRGDEVQHSGKTIPCRRSR